MDPSSGLTKMPSARLPVGRCIRVLGAYYFNLTADRSSISTPSHGQEPLRVHMLQFDSLVSLPDVSGADHSPIVTRVPLSVRAESGHLLLAGQR